MPEGIGPSIRLEPATTLLDRFTIQHELGRGNGSVVYLAEDLLLERHVAVKLAQLGPCEAQMAETQLKHETQVHARIADHRHVLRIYDLHLVPRGGSSLLLLSMEYAEGGSLRQWLLQNRERPEERKAKAIMYFRQICEGIAALHHSGIVHLDLKPENLLLVNDVLKVSDFGAAYRSDMNKHSRPVDLGTPQYMSPEHFTAPHPEDLDHRADIYSLGAILYEMLHPLCRPPYGGDYRRLRELHMEAPIPPLPEVEEKEKQIVQRCLAKNPQERFQSISELLDALDGKVSWLKGSASSQSEDYHDTDSDQVAALWEQTRLTLAKGEFTPARQLCRQILAICADHRDAETLLGQLDERFKQAEEFLQSISQQFDRRSLSELAELLREAFHIYPDHPSGRLVRVRLAVAARRYRQLMASGWSATRRKAWQAASAHFAEARRLNPGSPSPVQALDYCQQVQRTVRDLEGQLDRAIQQGDRRTAKALSRSLDDYMRRI